MHTGVPTCVPVCVASRYTVDEQGRVLDMVHIKRNQIPLAFTLAGTNSAAKDSTSSRSTGTTPAAATMYSSRAGMRSSSGPQSSEPGQAGWEQQEELGGLTPGSGSALELSGSESGAEDDGRYDAYTARLSQELQVPTLAPAFSPQAQQPQRVQQQQQQQQGAQQGVHAVTGGSQEVFSALPAAEPAGRRGGYLGKLQGDDAYLEDSTLGADQASQQSQQRQRGPAVTGASGGGRQGSAGGQQGPGEVARGVLRVFPYCIGSQELFQGLWDLDLVDKVRSHGVELIWVKTG